MVSPALTSLPTSTSSRSMRPVLLGSTLICDLARMSPLNASACWISPRWAASADTGGAGGAAGTAAGVAVRWQAARSSEAARTPPVTTWVDGRKLSQVKRHRLIMFAILQLQPRLVSRSAARSKRSSRQHAEHHDRGDAAQGALADGDALVQSPAARPGQ